MIVDLHVRPATVDEFVAAVTANARACLRDEPGCLRFDVLRDRDDEHRFLLYEVYADDDAFAAHRATPHFARWREAAARCLEPVGGQDNTYARSVGAAGGVPAGAGAPDDLAAVVFRVGAEPVIDRGGGVRTVHLASPAIGARQFRSGITEFDPGAALPLHVHNCEEAVTVLAGTARFEHDGRTAEMRAGDSTWVPAGVPHRFVNGGTDLMRIAWVYGRADATRTLLSTGETIVIGSGAERSGFADG